jgi:hypothetical protein
MILEGHDLPPREEIIAAFLEAALLIQRPQLSEESSKRETRPDWLKSVYQRSSIRTEQCKDLAALLASSSDVQLHPIFRKPLLSEEARKKIVTEVVQAAPILEGREEQLAEVERLAGINRSSGKLDLITPFAEQQAQKRRLRESLYSLSDEDLNARLLQERQRIANDMLSDTRHGVRF